MTKNLVEKLEEYFKNTPREKVLEDWNKSKEYDNVGPTLEEFLKSTKKQLNNKEMNKEIKTPQGNEVTIRELSLTSDRMFICWIDKYKRKDKVFVDCFNREAYQEATSIYLDFGPTSEEYYLYQEFKDFIGESIDEEIDDYKDSLKMLTTNKGWLHLLDVKLDIVRMKEWYAEFRFVSDENTYHIIKLPIHEGEGRKYENLVEYNTLAANSYLSDMYRKELKAESIKL